MTKVVKKMIKCAKCGAESLQTVVCSINFSLGNPEDNQALLHHMQKCPHCKYESINISEIKHKE